MNTLDPSSAKLTQAMYDFAERSEALEQAQKRYSNAYYQGIITLAGAVILGISGWFSLITLILALFACWRIMQCFAIDETSELFEAERDLALEELNRLLAKAKYRNLFPLCYQQLNGKSCQRFLAHYLPGPIEVCRRPAKWCY